MMRSLHFVTYSDRHSRRYSFCLGSFVLPILLLLPRTAATQQTAAESLAGTAVCTFDDGKQVSSRYKPAATRGEVPAGKVWAPGGVAMTMFTETEIMIANTSVAPGAYTMYLLPGKKDWTLIVSRNATVDGRYDQNQDLVRATMQTGELSQAEKQLKVFFGHIAPKRCEINVDYGNSRAWIDLTQK